jgi:uncharacterized PurR-regulated membrane protein YhhQ (DUF165 family)
MKTTLLTVSFLSTIPIANFLINNFGVVCITNGPCLIPVAPGLMAPSGVLMIGVALALRDALHERLSRWIIVALIASGAVLSLSFSPPALAGASAVAFLFSELADFAVYDRFRKRAMAAAVLVSGAIGAVLDSMIFSALAFGTIKWAPGLILAKCYASIFYAGWKLWRGK